MVLEKSLECAVTESLSANNHKSCVAVRVLQCAALQHVAYCNTVHRDCNTRTATHVAAHCSLFFSTFARDIYALLCEVARNTANEA